ncbi:MAG: hypothetical protein K2N38_13800 [Oscillospiraceae bacterium]|nr:hypothetical protein [Oscillospiraceae bacterium]
MTDGTFRTWEMFTAAIGGVIGMFAMFYQNLIDGHISKAVDPKLATISVAVLAAGLFAKPIWLLGNWKEIRTWERTTAFVRKSHTTGLGRGERHHIYIEFFSKDGKVYHKWLEGSYAAYFKVGDKKDIMFAKEYMDALIFVPQAFRQAVISAVAGVLIESAAVVCLIVFS